MKAKTYSFKNNSWSSDLKKNDSKNLWVILFADRKLIESSKFVGDVHECFPEALFTGCSTSGEINGVEVSEGSASLMVIDFEKTELKSSLVDLAKHKDSLKSGVELGSLLESEGLKSVFILSEGLNVNGTALVNGLTKALGSEVIIFGGLAGDGARFEKTQLIYNGELLQDHVLAVGLYGDSIQVGSSSFGGWRNFGPVRKVTKSVENVLYELDGRPALEVYKEYLGKAAEDLPSSALLYPLSIQHGEDHLIRTVLSVDEEEQAMTFAGNIPEGYTASLMNANFDGLVGGATKAYEQAQKDLGPDVYDGETVCLAISCVGRKLVMGSRVEDETEAAEIVLKSKFKQIGFYSYGEIGLQNKKTILHNQTYTLALIREKV